MALKPFDGHSRPTTDVIQSEVFTIAFDYVGGSDPVYIGFTVPGNATSDAAWQIRKLTYDSGNVTNIQFAGGSTDYTAVWDNRASLLYS